MDFSESTDDSLVIHETYDEIKQKLANKVYTLSLKRGRSRAWELFGEIETDTGEILPKVVGCKQCHSVFKFSSTTSNLVKHKCYMQIKAELEKNEIPVMANIDAETKKNVERLVLQWTIENCRPIDVIEDSGLQKLAECLVATGAKHGANVDMEELLPQPAAISRNVTKLHADYVAKLKTELKSIRNVGYSLTPGVWSDAYLCATYLFLTVHYIKNGELVSRFLGLESIEGFKCTGEDIKLAVEDILNKFECTLDDKPTLVTDNSENMVEAFQENVRVYCINHLLQCALEEAINETPDIRQICEQSTKLFNFLSKFSKIFASSLENGPAKRLHTIFHMLSSIFANYKEVVKICKTHNGEGLCILDHLNLDKVKEIINVLESFEEVSKELESDDGPTLHLTIVHMHRLKKIFIKSIADTEMIRKFKGHLVNHFEKYIWKNMSLQQKVALYLFPPANKLIAFSEIDKELVRSECKRIMRTFADETAPETTVAYSAMQIDDKQTIHHYDQLSDEEENFTTPKKPIKNPKIFEDFVETSEKLNSAEERVKNEIRLYEDTNVLLHDNFHVLQWWHVNKAQFPLLYKASCKILATPATSAASERVILKAKPLIFECSGAVDGNPESVNEIMFLHCNVEKNEMFYEMITDENF